MATVLQGRAVEEGEIIGDGGPAFAEVFVIVWLGSLVVTLNTKLLGGHISFFQSVCVLGNLPIARPFDLLKTLWAFANSKLMSGDAFSNIFKPSFS